MRMPDKKKVEEYQSRNRENQDVLKITGRRVDDSRPQRRQTPQKGSSIRSASAGEGQSHQPEKKKKEFNQKDNQAKNYGKI